MNSRGFEKTLCKEKCCCSVSQDFLPTVDIKNTFQKLVETQCVFSKQLHVSTNSLILMERFYSLLNALTGFIYCIVHGLQSA